MEQKHILHYVIGILIGIVATSLICFNNHHRNMTPMMNNQGTHTMSDGSVMNSGMGMASMMASMNAALQGKKGDSFDEAFIDEMIVHHQGAIDMAKLALTNGKHQEIKELANAIISAQTSEINQMKQWKSAWFK